MTTNMNTFLQKLEIVFRSVWHLTKLWDPTWCMPAGLQQLQMDMYYMRPKLLRLLGGTDAEAVAQLLDEVVAAGAERSVDPSMLEVATLEKALASLNR